MVESKTVPVDSRKITGKDIIGIVDSLAKTGSDAYRNYLFQDITAQRQTLPTVQVPVEYAKKQGWTPGLTIGLVVGAIGIGALLYYLSRPKGRKELPFGGKFIDVKATRI